MPPSRAKEKATLVATPSRLNPVKNTAVRTNDMATLPSAFPKVTYSTNVGGQQRGKKYAKFIEIISHTRMTRTAGTGSSKRPFIGCRIP